MKILKRGILCQSVPLGRDLALFGASQYYSPAFSLAAASYYYNTVGGQQTIDPISNTVGYHPLVTTGNTFELFDPGPETKTGEIDLTGLGDNVFAFMSDHYSDGNGYTYSFSETLDVDTLSIGDQYLFNAYGVNLRLQLELISSPYTVMWGPEVFDYGTRSPIIPSTAFASGAVKIVGEYWTGSWTALPNSPSWSDTPVSKVVGVMQMLANGSQHLVASTANLTGL